MLIISKLAPFLVKPPAMMQMGDATVPFAQIERQMRGEGAVVRRFLLGLAVAAVASAVGVCLRKALAGGA